jgi:acyl-CoA synthetase (AMP-forming)/AMP-acid ligase II
VLPETTREAAERFGEATAYVADDGRTLSFVDLDRDSDAVAAGLIRRGVREGDVVALALPPSLEYVTGYLAAAKVGAVTTGVNDRLTAGEQAAVLEIASPTLVISTADELAELRVRDATPPPIAADEDRPVAIVFTSGTTGTPKGALYTNRQLAFITQTDTGGAWGGGAGSIAGTAFAHLGFMTKLPGNLRRGGTNYILRRWRADACLALIAEHRMSTIAGVPTQLALMLRQPDFDAYDLESVRFLIAGGGPITPGLAEESRARFGAKLATRYSCTEAGIGLGTAFDDPDEDAIVSVGCPHPSVDLGLFDDDDRPVPTGEVGQVCLRSPAVMSGYWRDPEGTKAAFTADGFVRTGDLGWLDDRGRLRLVGRSKEMYVRGGYNVYPVEVEAVLSTHPKIAAVAVVPRPDPVMGEVGVAVCVARVSGDAPSLDELRAFAAERLAAYKLPEAVALVDALPLTAGEKIDRVALAKQVKA